MRWLAAARWCLAAALLCAGSGLAFAQGAATRSAPLALRDTQPTLEAAGLARSWVDPDSVAVVEQVASAAGQARFGPADASRVHKLGNGATLWLHYRLARPAGERQDWLIEFPMPVLDHVTVYQQERGRWRGETAGDTVPVASWPEAGRYPFFRLDLPPGQTRDVFVRIRHVTAADFPVLLTTQARHGQRIQLEYLGLGATFGALLLLIASCIAQGWLYRDTAYLWYAGYASITTLAVSAYTGAAAHLLWPGFGLLGDAPMAMLTFLAGGAALLFVRNLVGVSPRLVVVDRLIQGLGFAGFGLALLPPLIPKMPGLFVLSVYIVIAASVNVWLAAAAWRRDDQVGKWVGIAYFPLMVAVTLGVLRMFGWLPVTFVTQYAVVLAMALEVPLLLVALSIRSRDRHGVEIREQALSTQDALTGLLAPHLFNDRLRQVLARHRRDKESAAIVYIELVNHDRIKAHYGNAVAEQSLLRSVIKLRRLLRDVDTVSRVGEARFGVILEGVSTRAAVTDRAARLIAAGLMPLAGLKPEVTLQFHIAAILLDERTLEAEELLAALAGLLDSMSPRTRRPIRFVPPEQTQPAPVAPDSSLLDIDPDDDFGGPTRPQLAAVK